MPIQFSKVRTIALALSCILVSSATHAGSESDSTPPKRYVNIFLSSLSLIWPPVLTAKTNINFRVSDKFAIGVDGIYAYWPTWTFLTITTEEIGSLGIVGTWFITGSTFTTGLYLRPRIGFSHHWYTNDTLFFGNTRRSRINMISMEAVFGYQLHTKIGFCLAFGIGPQYGIPLQTSADFTANGTGFGIAGDLGIGWSF